jgi:CHASE3 domain sensor protein
MKLLAFADRPGLSTQLGFLIAAAVIAVMGWTLYDATLKASAASHWVSHTQDVLQAIGDVDAHMGRAESAQRGYLLSGSDAFSHERDAEVTRLQAEVARVAKLTTDNPAQQARTTRLATLVAQRVDIMMANARRRQTEGLDAASAFAATGAGQRASEGVYAETQKIEEEELRLLALRRADEQRRLDRTLIVLAVAMFVTLTVLVPAYLGFMRQSRKRERIERQLRDLAESLPVTVYQFRTRTGKGPRFDFVGSRVQQVHGVSIEAALRDASAIWDTIVEADRHAYVQAMGEALKNLTPIEWEYRIAAPDGSMRWVRSSAALRR